ncbi:hypothetical protein [Streptomyces sviceus]|uniref:hypothetical protein n=1 Tax=Streptomyces sviceus TaxID=285530 RepID=UPI0036E6D604
MTVVLTGIVPPVGLSGAARGGDEGAVDQDHLPALLGGLLQGTVHARRLGGEQGDQLVAPAADDLLVHVIAAGHVGQALVVTQHGIRTVTNEWAGAWSGAVGGQEAGGRLADGAVAQSRVTSAGSSASSTQLFGLSPEDIDFASGGLHVRRQVQAIRGKG